MNRLNFHKNRLMSNMESMLIRDGICVKIGWVNFDFNKPSELKLQRRAYNKLAVRLMRGSDGKQRF